MTAAAQAIPALEVSAPDDNMDVLSDTGFDFDDGDIDLDLDTAPSVPDEDMSLNDAATDGGIDMQDSHVDQDDFMADHGDLIEEDEAYDNDGDTAVSQVVDESEAAFEADMLAPPDEDLIDYSDDEAQQQIKMQSPSVHEAEEEATIVASDAEVTSVSIDVHDNDVQTQEGEQPAELTETSSNEAKSHEDDILKTLERTDASAEHHLADADSQRDVDDDHAHAEDGGVPLPQNERLPYDENALVEQEEEAQQDVGDGSDRNHSNDLEIELRPVTVNYAGNELWLFKQHDLDESGDFLLEDLSVARSSISDVFQACRLSLGDDVSGEHEIGIRFDSLHNLELYEDNTACVAVSMERLVDLYHTLQAQDGNEDPECFYVTLQFRPRFATLLADVAQYAEQGSGYSAFDAAVAAGETHFSNVLSGASTEHEHVEWDDDEVDDEEASSPGLDRSITPEQSTAGQHDEPPSEVEDEDEEEQENEDHDGSHSQNDTHHQEGVNLEQASSQIGDTHHEEARDIAVTTNDDPSEISAPLAGLDQKEAVYEPETEAVAEQHSTVIEDERTPDQIAHDKQEAEDFVDYSDDEDDQVTKSVPAHTPSPSSSTVQGDEPTEIPEPGTALDYVGLEDQGITNVGFDENDDDTTLLTQTQYGDDAGHYAFQDYTETYEQNDSVQDDEADGTSGDPFEVNGIYTGDTNQGFAGHGFQNTDGEVDLGFGNQPLDDNEYNNHGDDTFEEVEEVTHADAFLDLDNAPEWAIDADPAPNLPGEDAVLLHDDETAVEGDERGAVEEVEATISSGSDTTSTSLNDHKPTSPQGQKRSIDEVGDGVVDAQDLTDAKRPRV